MLQKELLNKYKLIIENPVIECHRKEGDLLNEVVDMKIVYNSTCPD